MPALSNLLVPSPSSSSSMARLHFLVPLFLLSFLLLCSGACAASFTITNNCNYPVWPGILSNAGIAPLSTTGFALDQSQSTSVTVPPGWSGSVWGRTLCTTDPTTSRFACVTGDCGSSSMQCSGGGAAPPATLAEFTLNGANNLDFYDVNLVNGYNLPMLITPQGGNCSLTGCVADLNGPCPLELKVTVTDGAGAGAVAVACKSACDAFGEPQYCCSGAYGTPDKCKPSSYSQFFKNKCPRAYSYAYDDGTSTFTCGSGGDYIITFCPSPTTSLNSANNGYPEAVKLSAGTRSTCPYLTCCVVISIVMAAIRLGRAMVQKIRSRRNLGGAEQNG